ncbi:NlpC/P60 family protein [Mobilicoccus pelagius]|uniref:NlpC/P60 family protein n=1 Tax=Mobilicoccus pelagius TaxID=746032 RepID=UPI000A01E825|nr:NlpC/P60 family protein [Mobilicoccus pelagius]
MRAAQAGALVLLTGGLLNAAVASAFADPAPPGRVAEDPGWEPDLTAPRPAEPRPAEPGPVSSLPGASLPPPVAVAPPSTPSTPTGTPLPQDAGGNGGGEKPGPSAESGRAGEERSGHGPAADGRDAGRAGGGRAEDGREGADGEEHAAADSEWEQRPHDAARQEHEHERAQKPERASRPEARREGHEAPRRDRTPDRPSTAPDRGRETRSPSKPRRPVEKRRSPRKAPEASRTTRQDQGRKDVLGIAGSLSGIPYVWGGTSTRGFDCSGYTQHVFRKAGVSLPRTAAQQQRATTRVRDPRPGDLVFFGTPAHHVGIYAGDGKMYDAPRTGRTTGLHRIWSSNVTYGRP